MLVGEPEELEALVGVEAVALVSEWELLVDWRRWLVNGRC